MEDNSVVNYELFEALYSNEPDEVVKARFKKILEKAKCYDKDNLPDCLDEDLENVYILEDMDSEEFGEGSNMEYPNDMQEDDVCCREDIHFPEPSPNDISRHMRILVDVAMRDRNIKDVEIVRHFLETYNRMDNHLIEPELPRLDAYIDSLDGYRKYMSDKGKVDGHKIGRKKENLFVSDENSYLKDEDVTAEQSSAFIEFLTQNGWDSLSTSASKSSKLNIAIFAFLKYWKENGIMPPEHVVSANAIYRFLTEDCHISRDATIKSFNNVFSKCNGIENKEMDAKVVEFYHRK